jgi:hypothetical protein
MSVFNTIQIYVQNIQTYHKTKMLFFVVRAKNEGKNHSRVTHLQDPILLYTFYCEMVAKVLFL